MNSWDCFDTLIARRYYYPYTVFDEVGKRLNIPNFRDLRIEAERRCAGPGCTYEKIYQNLPGIDPQVEIDVELEHCFPIVENLKMVNDGDIIISDMYLSAEIISKMLQKCGLNKLVKIIVSYDGKHSGRVWQTLPPIKCHTGDNKFADYIQPIKANRVARLYTEHLFTEEEKKAYETDKELACWMRYMRLQYEPCESNLARQDFLKEQKLTWIGQCNKNLPVLANAVKYLEDKGDLAFVYRDCHILHPLYEVITGKIGTRFNHSRLAIQINSDNFKNYANKTVGNKTIVDIHSSGTSISKLFPNHKKIFLTTVLTGIPINFNTNVIDIIISKQDTESDMIERLNPVDYGSLVDVDDDGSFLRLKCEYPNLTTSIVEKTKQIALKSVKNFNIKYNYNLMVWLLNNNKCKGHSRFFLENHLFNIDAYKAKLNISNLFKTSF